MLYRKRLYRFVVWLIAAFVFQQNGIAPDSLVAQDTLVVHEWGTFTELQNEQGVSLTGINTDDEPVPRFVYGWKRVLDPPLGNGFSSGIGKSFPFQFKHLTMRLETPVIYFYPPSDEPMSVDVKVGLLDGWLSEYYPKAEFEAKVAKGNRVENGSYGTLTWNDLTIGAPGIFRETQDPVWLNPRATRAATVTNAEGESEKYLFYRGVGEFSGPIKLELDRQAGTITPSTMLPEERGDMAIPAWLLDVREHGGVAFRKVELPYHKSSTSVPTSYRFSDNDYQSMKLDDLKKEMHQSLVESGLYVDEAAAMLATWDHAYFKSPGLRLFYVVPKLWVEKQMPLTITAETSTDVERVMVGRIELISDSQQKLVDAISSQPVGDAKWMTKMCFQPQWLKIRAGKEIAKNLAQLGNLVPKNVASYLKLGRFRNAILQAKVKSQPKGNLADFVQFYINSYQSLPTGLGDTLKFTEAFGQTFGEENNAALFKRRPNLDFQLDSDK